jgi:hypothetical protein
VDRKPVLHRGQTPGMAMGRSNATKWPVSAGHNGYWSQCQVGCENQHTRGDARAMNLYMAMNASSQVSEVGVKKLRKRVNLPPSYNCQNIGKNHNSLPGNRTLPSPGASERSVSERGVS